MPFGLINYELGTWNRMDDATLLFNKVFFALTGTSSDTMSFCQIVLGGVAAARERLLPAECRLV